MKKAILLLFLMIISCTESDKDNCEPFPKLVTNEATDTTDTSVKISGRIIPPSCEGTVTSQGFVYSETTLPKTDNNVVEKDGENIMAVLSNLKQNTTYYARTFFENPTGIYYGNQIVFKTSIGQSLLTTNNITQITKITALTGGKISSDGGSLITSRGVCWSTSTNPTISDNKSENGNGVGNFTSTMNNLTPNTTYYVKSYAINELGVSYGNELSFKTDCDVPSGNIPLRL